ncbi:MAG TPA: cupin domain-containing protein [Planctomycetota bacterium]|nr:cupin domain-containing protein [Planctomycetota bacterium]
MTSSTRTAAEAAACRIEEDWGSLTWLAGRKIGNAEGLTLGRVVIQRGQSNPRHSHPNCEEALYLLKGRLRHTMGDEEVTLEPGDTIVLDAAVPHNATSIGDEDADMIVAYSSADRGFRAET